MGMAILISLFEFGCLAVFVLVRPVVLWRLRSKAKVAQMVFESEHPEDQWDDRDRAEAIRCRMQLLAGRWIRWMV